MTFVICQDLLWQCLLVHRCGLFTIRSRCGRSTHLPHSNITMFLLTRISHLPANTKRSAPYLPFLRPQPIPRIHQPEVNPPSENIAFLRERLHPPRACFASLSRPFTDVDVAEALEFTSLLQPWFRSATLISPSGSRSTRPCRLSTNKPPIPRPYLLVSCKE